ncbi:MAG TPA: hypothetical protein VKZ59_07570, partial [Acidobacteriota bacterium]|nr:hypothetical protein [Acidobacteriota bacterium]
MMFTILIRYCFRVLLVGLYLTLTGLNVMAQQEHLYQFDLDIGYRWSAYFRGSQDLYRTQLDLGEGPKLFSANLLYAPPEGETGLFDRAQVKLDGWGGEPHNAGSLQLGRDGAYDFRFYYRNFHYFSSIPYFANPLFGAGNLQSQHRFDTSLRTTGFEMAILPGHRFSPFIAYHRSSQEGTRGTTLTADGDDFVMDSQLDIQSDDLSGGIQMLISRLSLRLEQGIRWYHDETSFFSGASPGNSDRIFFGRPIFLDQYAGQNNVDATIPYTNATVVFQMHDTLTLRGTASYSIADMRAQLFEVYSGNFFRLPPTSAFYG